MRRYDPDHYRRPLSERWNVAMTEAGFVGSEFIDEPERVSVEVQRMRQELHRFRLAAARARKGPA